MIRGRTLVNQNIRLPPNAQKKKKKKKEMDNLIWAQKKWMQSKSHRNRKERDIVLQGYK